MEKEDKYKLNEINNLRLIDIKAQKKTIPFKRFCKIPLSYEEELKQNFQTATRCHFSQPTMKQKVITHPKNRNLSRKNQTEAKRYRPKSIEVLGLKFKDQKIDKILKNCSKLLKTGSGFKWKFNRFEKGSRRCLEEIKQKLDFLLTNDGGNWNLI